MNRMLSTVVASAALALTAAPAAGVYLLGSHRSDEPIEW